VVVATEPAGNWPDSWSCRSSQPWIFALRVKKQFPISSMRTGGVWLASLLYSGEAPIPSYSAVEPIEIRYPELNRSMLNKSMNWQVLFKVLSLSFEHRFQMFYRIQNQTENIKDAFDLKFELVSKTPLHNFTADFRRNPKKFPQSKAQFSSRFLEANPSNL
jgi:hypothetical protein